MVEGAAGPRPAQDPDEPFDVVTADNRPTGVVKPRAAVHRDGDWHRSVHVWVAGVGGDGPFLLFQRRSPAKDTWPGRLDATVGGHFGAGEGLTEALREVEEEIGAVADPAALRFLGIRVCANEAEPGIRDRELQHVLLLRDDRPLTAWRPDAAEVDALVRFPLAPLRDFLAGEATTIAGEVLPAAGGLPRPTLFGPVAFIPTVDRYFYRVAIAAAAVLRGDRHAAV